MRTNIYLIIVLSTICFSSCCREKDLKYSLNAAGKNRIELEKVLEHYKDSGPKYDAACFLIKNMPGYYSYAKSSGLDSLRKIQSVIFHKNIFLVICKTDGVSSPTRAHPRCMTVTL